MHSKETNRPLVGLGILLFNEKNQVLLGVRQNIIASGYWGTPGGHMEYGESFEECAIREVYEEVGVNIQDPVFVALTNNIFHDLERHYVSVYMRAFLPEGAVIQNCEADKVISWEWFDWDKLPNKLLPPMEKLLQDARFKDLKYLFSLNISPEMKKPNTYIMGV